MQPSERESVCEVWLSAPTYRFAPTKKQLISRQGEVAGFPALDELPADLLLLQLPLNERLSFLVHNCRDADRRRRTS